MAFLFTILLVASLVWVQEMNLTNYNLNSFGTAVPVSLASFTRGENYSIATYSNGMHTFTGGLPARVVASNGTYVSYIFNQNSTHLWVDSKMLPFAMNKTDCTLTFYEPSKPISQNPVVFVKKVWEGLAQKPAGASSWTELNVLSVPCTYSTVQNSTGLY